MPIRIDTLTEVPESKFLELMRDYKEIDNADVVTAYRDEKGTFTVESTIFDRTAAAGAAGQIITLKGKMSHFGGPDDHGVAADEGLALCDDADIGNIPGLFLPTAPPGTSGLARRLNPQAKYLACRWDYTVTPRDFLRAATVKVSNPANGRSESARPVDWGPNAATGRVADLSPGLETALGLKTDGVCVVEIPTPAGTELPPPGAGIAVGVNLAAIDATIFPPDMARKLVVMTTTDNSTYWVVNQIGENDGGQSLLRHVGGNTEVLLSDTTVFPVEPSGKVPAVVADELNKAMPREAAASAGPLGTPPGPSDDVSAKVFAAANAFLGHDTSNAPNTDHGNLACAWAVNEVVRRALGKPISANKDGSNGLGTDGLFAELRDHHTPLAAPKPGAIVISPTPASGRVHGHVGILGRGSAGSVDSTQVFSNSSSRRQFAQNYTVGTWVARYATRLHLQVLFFELNRDRF